MALPGGLPTAHEGTVDVALSYGRHTVPSPRPRGDRGGDSSERRPGMPRKRRPVRVCQILEATEGGTREHFRQISTYPDRDRFELTFVVSPLREPSFAQDVAKMRALGHEVVLIPMRRAVRPLADTVACLRILRFLARRRFDIVHTHSSKAGILGRVAAWLAGVPVVIHTPHVLPFEQRTGWLARGIYRWAELLAGRLSTRLVALSAYEKRLMIRTGIARPWQVQIIHNGVELREPMSASARRAKRRELSLSPDAFVVGCVGRLVEQKGHVHLIRAARQVVDGVPNAVFLIAGDGPLRGELCAEAARLGLADRIRFLGQREDVPELMEVFDVFGLPSLWEAMPYTILEAMAAGLPVVVSNVSGLGEFVQHDRQGLLVPLGDAASLAGAVMGLGTDRGRRTRMGARGRGRVNNHYGVPRFAAMLERLYANSTVR